jgi:hypothetical protein
MPRNATPVAPKCPIVFVKPRPANSPAPLTRHFSYHSDKLSRLALPSESGEYDSPCKIRSLPEGERMAPILPELLALTRLIPQVNSIAGLNDTA